jgi:hypothetical protein
LPAKTVVTPAGLPDGLRVSASERAVLELLYDVGTRQSLDEARNLFDGVRSPRKELMGQLLASCTNVKTVRLFLTWARESGLLDVDDLRARYPLRTGSDKRWMSRMPDGTLLTLEAPWISEYADTAHEAVGPGALQPSRPWTFEMRSPDASSPGTAPRRDQPGPWIPP